MLQPRGRCTGRWRVNLTPRTPDLEDTHAKRAHVHRHTLELHQAEGSLCCLFVASEVVTATEQEDGCVTGRYPAVACFPHHIWPVSLTDSLCMETDSQTDSETVSQSVRHANRGARLGSSAAALPGLVYPCFLCALLR